MTERKESLKIVEGVREKAARIIDSSHDLIQIDETAIETVLIPRIQKFLENQKAEGWAPAGGELPVEQELGVNLFLDVINFCYKDPYSGHEYAYTNPGQFKRATGLLQALVDSGVDWNDFSKVSAISAKQWTEIVQLSPNNPMYLGEERGERLVKMADYLLSQGIPTMTDLLDSIDYDAINLVEFLQEINYYSTLRAQELYTAGQHASFFQIVFYPLIKFKYLYFLKLGLLDGTVGFVHAMTMAFYSFLVRGKLWLLWRSR